MKIIPLSLTAAMTAALLSCGSSNPPPAPGGGSGIGDPLSAPLGASAPEQPQTQAPAPTVNLNPGKYPLAVKTPDPEIVLSPHKPYNKVRVDPNKFKSGDLAEDPDNRGKYFRVP